MQKTKPKQKKTNKGGWVLKAFIYSWFWKKRSPNYIRTIKNQYFFQFWRNNDFCWFRVTAKQTWCHVPMVWLRGAVWQGVNQERRMLLDVIALWSGLSSQDCCGVSLCQALDSARCWGFGGLIQQYTLTSNTSLNISTQNALV